MHLLSNSASEDVQNAVDEACICEVPCPVKIGHDLPAVGGDLVAQHGVDFLVVVANAANEENVLLVDADRARGSQVELSCKQVWRFRDGEFLCSLIDLELVQIE